MILKLLVLSMLASVMLEPSEAFTTTIPEQRPRRRQQQHSTRFVPSSPFTVLNVSKLRGGTASTSASTEEDEYHHHDDDDQTVTDDETLLRQTKRSQLVDLCTQFGLPTKGTKEDLLRRLRQYAQSKIDEERRRLQNRKRKVEEGRSDDEREKYEIVGGGEENDDEVGEGEDDEGPYMYYESKEDFSKYLTHDDDDNNGRAQRQKPVIPTTRESLLAPPPPDVEPNDDGERVVTVYSTTDHNDLTGIAAAQPREAILQDPMTGTVAEPNNAPWDLEKQQQQNQRSGRTSSAELDAAREDVTELISSLLAMTGAPGFQSIGDDGHEDNIEMFSSQAWRPGGKQTSTVSSFEAPHGFIGFDPTKVSTDVLARASRNLRLGRGRVLQDVIREFELRAVGYDGAAGDDKGRGGGHYQQVSLIRSFLEGFRRAEVRRLARETATLLLDRLVTDGIEGLDVQ
jgi:hypothetical protein